MWAAGTTKERNARGKGLKVFEINDKTGDWNLIQCLKTEEENPSYQTLDNEGNFLYSVHGDKTKSPAIKILEDRNFISVKYDRYRRKKSGVHHC